MAKKEPIVRSASPSGMDGRRPDRSKRAPLPRASDHTKKFTRDWENLSRSGRYNMRQLKEAMLLLIANDAPLGPEWLDRARHLAPSV